MKWTVLVGILGVGMGYLVGRGSGEAERVGDEGGELVRSERRVGSSGANMAEGYRGKGGSEAAEAALKEFEFEGCVTQLARVRLMKWIFELEASEFPGVMEKLADLESFADPILGDHRPFGYQDMVEFVKYGFARWYELEGEVALEWMLGNREFSKKWHGTSLIYDVIQDGYGRDPDRSFVLFWDHLLRSRGEDLHQERFGGWGYEIGKCSMNFERDLFDFMALSQKLEANIDGKDPFGGDEGVPNLTGLMKGALLSGRGVEMKRLLGSVAPEALAEFGEIEEGRKIRQVEIRGWEAVRTAMDSGLVAREEGAARNILDEWSKRDLEGATEWYLSHGVEGQSREEQIWTAAYHLEFDGESGPFEPSSEEIEFVFQFLEQQKANGESVDYAQGELVDMARRMENWDVLLKVEEKVSPAIWNRVLTGVKEEIVGRESIKLKGEEALKFLAISEEDTAVLERFGMRDEVIEEIARTNEESLKELQRRLGVE